MKTTGSAASPSFLTSVYRGARIGAADGAMVGSAFVTFTLGYTGVSGSFEAGRRAIGYDPRWPMFEGDCQLEQFRDLSDCTNPPMFQSFTDLTIYVVGATTLFGMVVGGVCGGIRNLYPQSPSEGQAKRS